MIVDGLPYLFKEGEHKQLLYTVTEYEILRQLAGVPRIPQPKDIYGLMVDGFLMVVTEMNYIPGMTVASLLQRKPSPQLDQGERFRIIHEAASTLQQVHQKGVVHKDVNPANMMYSRETDEGTNLVDFANGEFISPAGFSIPIPDDRRQFLTAARVPGELIIGTLPYIAPERIRHSTLGPGLFQSDIYELSVSCFEILRGRRPRICEDYTRALKRSHLSIGAFHVQQIKNYSNRHRDRFVQEMKTHGISDSLAEAIGGGLDSDPTARKLEDIITESGKLLTIPSCRQGSVSDQPLQLILPTRRDTAPVIPPSIEIEWS